MRLSLATAVAAAVLALAAGCGDDPDPVAEPTGAADVTVDPEAGDTCAYLDPETASSAVGEEVELTAAGTTSCLFGATESDLGITLNVTDIAIDVDEYAAGTRELCEDDLVEVEAGDTAFVCTTYAAPQGFVFGGGQSVLVEVNDAEDDTTAFGLLTALLPQVTFPG